MTKHLRNRNIRSPEAQKNVLSAKGSYKAPGGALNGVNNRWRMCSLRSDMAKGQTTRRQKDISRVLREKKRILPPEKIRKEGKDRKR